MKATDCDHEWEIHVKASEACGGNVWQCKKCNEFTCNDPTEASKAERMTTIRVKCRMCKREFDLVVKFEDFGNWRMGGVLIQDAMPYLTAGERELLISQTCEGCFHAMFKEV